MRSSDPLNVARISVVGSFGGIAFQAMCHSGILPLTTSWKLVAHIGKKPMPLSN